jgi:phosphoglycolate phosphatase
MKLVLFDCDGTLVDSQRHICAAMQQAYAAHGLPCPPEHRLLGIVGLSLEEAFRRLADGADHPVDGLIAGYRTAFFALREAGAHASPLYPGAREAIEALARRPDTLLGIATGKSRRGVAALLAQHDLANRFVTIQTADTAPSKPHPGMVLEAMRETGVQAADTVVIGDTAFDMQMARAAGARALGVSWGYHPVEDLHAAGAAAVVDDFAELPPALERLWAPSVVAANA